MNHTEIQSKNSVLDALADAISDVEKNIRTLRATLDLGEDMTGRQRQRLYGVKARNLGFIIRAAEVAREFPGFMPGNFSPDDLTENLAILERAQQLVVAAEQLRTLAHDFALKTGDLAYRGGLRVYGSLESQARLHVQGAAAPFEELSSFFSRRRKNSNEAEPTQHELELDARRLLHGRADGEMIIKHESPHKTGGVHEVVDDVHRHGRHDGASERE